MKLQVTSEMLQSLDVVQLQMHTRDVRRSTANRVAASNVNGQNATTSGAITRKRTSNKRPPEGRNNSTLSQLEDQHETLYAELQSAGASSELLGFIQTPVSNT